MKLTWIAVGAMALFGVSIQTGWGEEKKEEKPDAPVSKRLPGEAKVPTEKITIFNGKNLDGLYTYIRDTKYEDPRGVFTVTDGDLHISGDGWGYVATKQAYKDYHIVLEYRWGDRTWDSRKDRTKDSGLLVHSVGPDGGYGKGTWMPSIEVQIIEGGVGDFILVRPDDPKTVPVPFYLTCEVDTDRDGEIIWKKGGEKLTITQEKSRRINWFGRDPDWEDKLGFRGKDDPDSPGKLWTRIDVYCEGNTIKTFVNGVQVNEAIDCSPTEGQIQVQTELAELFVRRWELYPIGEGPKPAPAEQDE